MNANMKTTIKLGLVAAACVTLGLAAARGMQQKTAPSDPSNADRIERGKYLVTIGGCNDCHTPWKMGEKGPEPDMTRMLSGHPQDFVMPEAPKHEGSPWLMTAAATNTAWAGPWGVSFTANLTPDEDTGLGAWSEDIFINTLRTGKHWGQSRPILPPMPWFNYGKMSDEDLKSVYAYLRSIPPVHNRVPPPIPPGGADRGTELASN
jgi:mono/diheme cytochrome c family protein